MQPDTTSFAPDEPPTKPTPQFTTRVLVLAHKIDRLAEDRARRPAHRP
jgi:hypothetical protein